MLGIVNMAGNALKAFGNTHPAVKWGVIVLAFLLAAEFVYRQGIADYRDTVLLRPTIKKTNGDAATAAGQATILNSDDLMGSAATQQKRLAALDTLERAKRLDDPTTSGAIARARLAARAQVAIEHGAYCNLPADVRTTFEADEAASRAERKIRIPQCPAS